MFRQSIRVQQGNQKEIDYEIAKLQKHYPNAYIKPSLKPVEVIDKVTGDCNMLVDIIF